MAVRVIRENGRSAGLAMASGVDCVAGQVLIHASATTLRTYNDGTWAKVPYGIAAESTTKLPIAPSSGLVAGEGYDYTNFNRGGLVSCFIGGSELELFDDGRGAPYVTSDTYARDGKVYTDVNGKITTASDSDAAPLIGSVVDFDTASTPKRLRIKFTI